MSTNENTTAAIGDDVLEVILEKERGDMIGVTPLGWSPVSPHPERYGNIKDGALWELDDEDAAGEVGGLYCSTDDLLGTDMARLATGELVNTARVPRASLFWYDTVRQRMVGRVEEIQR